MSEGRKDEPMSTQPYLSISPLKKALRLVPFSRMTSARAMWAGSLIVSSPPSPAMTFLVSWKEKAPNSPRLPKGWPL